MRMHWIYAPSKSELEPAWCTFGSTRAEAEERYSLAVYDGKIVDPPYRVVITPKKPA